MTPPILTHPEPDVATASVATGSALDLERLAVDNVDERHDDLVALRDNVVAWSEANFAPLDVGILDPPDVCSRCQRPILADDPIDYLFDDDEAMTIVHENCSPAPPADS